MMLAEARESLPIIEQIHERRGNEKKKFRRFSRDELSILNQAFEVNCMPSRADRQFLADKLGVSSQSVRNWVCNNF